MSHEYINKEGQIDIDKLKAIAGEYFRKRYPEQNLMNLNDERAQQLSNLWWSQGKKAKVGQKNKVGIAYMSRILGIDSEVVRRFIKGDDYEAWRAVGMKQSGVPSDTDSSEFWNEVQNIFPGLHNESDRKFLIEEGGVVGIFHFMFQLDPILNEESPVMRKLNSNAHAYK